MNYPEPNYLGYVITAIVMYFLLLHSIIVSVSIWGAEVKSPQNCLSFHLELKNLIPSAEGYYNNDHIITKIGTSFLDSEGEQNGEGYLPFSDYGEIIRYQFREIMSEEDKFLWEKFYAKTS